MSKYNKSFINKKRIVFICMDDVYSNKKVLEGWNKIIRCKS